MRSGPRRPGQASFAPSRLQAAPASRHPYHLAAASARPTPGTSAATATDMIRKLPSGKYRLYSRKKDTKTGKRRNLGTFATRAAAQAHERAVQFFKRR